MKLHGPFKGFALTAKRVASCHPWGGHGWDPVPGSELEQQLKNKDSNHERLHFLAASSIHRMQSRGRSRCFKRATWVSELNYEGEDHFYGMRQLTDGDNAEAYFSFDGTMLTFQSNAEKWGNECDQIYAFNWDTDTILENEPPMISNGLGVLPVRTSYPATQPSSTLQHSQGIVRILRCLKEAQAALMSGRFTKTSISM